MNILKRYAQIFNVVHRILDLAVLLFLTWYMWKDFRIYALMKVLMIYGSALMVVIFSSLGVYRSWRTFSLGKQIRTLLLAWICVLLAFNIIILLLSDEVQLKILLPYGLFKTRAFLEWALAVFLGLAGLRIIVKLVLNFLRKKGYNQRGAVIVGANETGRSVAKHLHQSRLAGIRVVGFFDDDAKEGDPVPITEKHARKILGEVKTCAKFVTDNKIDMVFIALPMRAEQTINELIWSLGTKGVKVLMVPDLFALGIHKAKIYDMENLSLIDFSLFPAWKRPFDILFSLLIIVATFPLWLIIIILIKKEDGGAIFYRHGRITETGKKFKCFKFRSMHKDADKKLKDLLESDEEIRREWEKTYKIKNDPRVTKIGKFLRKTSLDELPQFLNVLAGDMSVVGARPVVAEELDKYYKQTALTYCATKPGVTGLWQAGKRSDIFDYDERVALDRWYMLNATPWLDIKIIFKTALRVFRPRGAY